MTILRIKLGGFLIFRCYDFFGISLEMNIQERLNNFFLKKLQYHSYRFFSENMSGSLISKFRKGVSAFEHLTDLFAWRFLPFLNSMLIILIIIGQQNLWISF